ncbi:phosphinothricin acetyltransferase [Klenkia marina]|uniref:Phosphinothricin acetyltransferase n=1 Tax=Klenkia marina TaxID=1960309 RepID=A0A1G4XPY7_9ACTN|nr:GNAT family N-acetyltransferase [Klenkia marina]SCX43175.1 phosphinothricin acetyltransferase [Klenkia marina]
MTVRPATPADVPALTAVYGHHVEHTLATFDLVPPTEADRAAWLAAHPGGRHRVLVVERDGAVVGFAASGPFRARPAYDATVETSIYLAPTATGQGLGRVLYGGLFDALAGEGLHRAVAVIAQPNPASEALHRAFGFSHVGTFEEVGRKFDRWVDVAWFQKEL